MHSLKQRLKRKLTNSPIWIDRPYTVQLDTIRDCNLSCVHCNVKKGGSFNFQGGLMDTKIFLQVMNYWKENLNGEKFGCVAPWMNGEPLLLKNLGDYVNWSKEFCNSKTVLDTNGTLYENRFKLLNSNIRLVRFTINSYNTETYEAIHGKDLLLEALDTLSFFKAFKFENQKIAINHIVNKYNIDEVDDFKRSFNGFDINIFPVHSGIYQIDSQENKTDQIKEFTRISENGEVSYPNRIKEKSMKYPCQCWDIMPIGIKGEIMQCVDYPPDINYGNVMKDDLLTAWKERNKNKMDNDYCNSCGLRFKNWKEVIGKWTK